MCAFSLSALHITSTLPRSWSVSSRASPGASPLLRLLYHTSSKRLCISGIKQDLGYLFLSQCLVLIKGEPSENVSCPTETRNVFLVTTPIGGSFESIVRALGNKPPLNAPIGWTVYHDRALPRITSRVRFATYYALCLIDRKIWLDNSLNLLDKFKGAKFWDRPRDSTMSVSSGSGSSSGPLAHYENECKHWQEKFIIQTDSIEEIGEITASDEEISKPTVYRSLRRGWIYLQLWWNCHDLAIRLVYLLIYTSDIATDLLKKLLWFLRIARDRKVYGKFEWTSFKLSRTGCTTFMGHTIKTVMMGPLGPVLPLIGTATFLSGWSLGLRSRVVRNTKQSQRKDLEEA